MQSKIQGVRLIIVQYLRNSISFFGLSLVLLLNSCATAPKLNQSKQSKQLLEDRTTLIRPLVASSKQIRHKMQLFRKALNTGELSTSEWRIHDELLEYYNYLKQITSTKLTIPSHTRVTLPLETYCLNASRAPPAEHEVFHWQKSTPGIRYFRELLVLRRKGEIKQSDVQELFWNLSNETRWDNYPERLKSILLTVDPQASIKLPSELKDQARTLITDSIIGLPGASEALDTYNLIKGKYYSYHDFKRSVESLTSKNDLSDYDDLTKIPGTEIYSQSKSDSYIAQEITFYNPTAKPQDLHLTEYYLAPERKDVQPIGVNPLFEDHSLLSDLEKLLFEDMLRLGIGFTPGLNDVADAYELLVGKDFLNGENLSATERALSGLGIIVGSGAAYRYSNRAVNAPTKYLGEFERGLEKAGARMDANLDQLEAKGALSKAEQTLSERRRLTKVRTYSAEEANRTFDPKYSPPYKPGTKVTEFRSIEGDKWVRVHGSNNQVGSWVVRQEAIKGLSPDAIRQKYSLPITPTRMSEVNLESGTLVRMGRVNDAFGGSAGARQYQIMDKVSSSWFKNTREL